MKHVGEVVVLLAADDELLDVEGDALHANNTSTIENLLQLQKLLARHLLEVVLVVVEGDAKGLAQAEGLLRDGLCTMRARGLELKGRCVAVEKLGDLSGGKC